MKRNHRDWYRDDLARLYGLPAAGRLKPVIADRLPLDEVVTAHRKLEQAEVQGRDGTMRCRRPDLIGLSDTPGPQPACRVWELPGR